MLLTFCSLIFTFSSLRVDSRAGVGQRSGPLSVAFADRGERTPRTDGCVVRTPPTPHGMPDLRVDEDGRPTFASPLRRAARRDRQRQEHAGPGAPARATYAPQGLAAHRASSVTGRRRRRTAAAATYNGDDHRQRRRRRRTTATTTDDGDDDGHRWRPRPVLTAFWPSHKMR